MPVDLAATMANAYMQIARSAQKHDSSREDLTMAMAGKDPYFERQRMQEEEEAARATEELMPQLARLDDRDYRAAIGELKSAIGTPAPAAPTMPEVGAPGALNILAAGVAGLRDPVNAPNYMAVPFAYEKRKRDDQWKSMQDTYEQGERRRKDRLGMLGDLATLEQRQLAENAQTQRFNVGQANDMARENADREARVKIATEREAGLTLRNQNSIEGRRAKAVFDFQKGVVMAQLKAAGDLVDPAKRAQVLTAINGMVARGEVDPEVLQDPDFVAALSGETFTAQGKASKIDVDKQRIETEKARRAQIFEGIKLSESRRAKLDAETSYLPDKEARDWALTRARVDDINSLIENRGRVAALNEAKADVQNAKIILDGITKSLSAQQKKIDELKAYKAQLGDDIKSMKEGPEKEAKRREWNAIEARVRSAAEARDSLKSESDAARKVLEDAIGRASNGRVGAGTSTGKRPKPLGGNFDEVEVQPYRPQVENWKPRSGFGSAMGHIGNLLRGSKKERAKARESADKKYEERFGG